MKISLVSVLVACLLGLAVAPVARADHNDDFVSAVPFAIGDDDTETTVGLGIEGNEWMTSNTLGYCQGQSSGVDAVVTAWHDVVGNGRTLTAFAHSPQHGVVIAVYSTVDFNQLERNVVGCGYDQTFSRQSASVTWASQPGVRYRVQ